MGGPWLGLPHPGQPRPSDSRLPDAHLGYPRVPLRRLPPGRLSDTDRATPKDVTDGPSADPATTDTGGSMYRSLALTSGRGPTTLLAFRNLALTELQQGGVHYVQPGSALGGRSVCAALHGRLGTCRGV